MLQLSERCPGSGEESPSTNLSGVSQRGRTCWDTLWGWKLVSPISELCLHCTSGTPVSPGGELLHLSGVLGFVAATQDTLECLFGLEAMGLIFLGLWNCDIWRDSSWQTTTPREPDSRLRHTPSLSKNGAIYCPGSFGLSGRITVWLALEEPMEGCQETVEAGGCSCCLLQPSADLPEPCLVPQCLQLLSGGTPTLPSSGGQRA